MDPRIQASFDLTECQRAALRDRVCTLNEAQRLWSPRSTVWNVQQIVEHLVLSSEIVGRAQKSESLRPEAPMFRILPRAWRRTLLLRALNADIALPLPSPSLEPGGNTPLDALLARWDAARDAMHRDMDALAWDEASYAHPVVGPLTAGQVLQLAEAHTAYHTRQIEALQRDPAFPIGSGAS